MMSGLTSLGVLTRAGGTRRANNFPDLVISTGSPSAIHAATRGKLFRKSLTVAVFMVRQICITELNLSRTAFFRQIAGLNCFIPLEKQSRSSEADKIQRTAAGCGTEYFAP